MRLRWYQWPRLVVLSTVSTALEAARALENNQIGTLLVQRQGRIAGIVTDRDLALRVTGRGLDPATTTLDEVMTPDVAVLSPDDTYEDALRVMQQRAIRRVPLAVDGRPVGIVTLDDLVLDEAAPLDELAGVIRAQVGAGGPTAPRRDPAQRRRSARAEATLGRLLNQLRVRASLADNEQARTVLEVVLGALVRRLTPGGAENLLAQLPSLLQERLRAQPLGPDRGVTREAIESALVQRLDIDPARAAELAGAVGGLLAESVSAGQVADVRAQLPEEMRDLVPAP